MKTFMIGENPKMLELQALIEKVAATPASVLILGESGTGKELIAKLLHEKSDRAAKPFVSVNCGALQESLLESELFGHERGSFTGAVNLKVGLCEIADGGTLFLDEIGEMSPSMQTKLLRFLQEGEFYRVGGQKKIQVHVRIVAATNRQLEKEIQLGRFREDLYYRLNTITMELPSLRNRKDDIPHLIRHFLAHGMDANAPEMTKSVDSAAMDALTQYPWPGNIRELQNVVERLRILVEGNEIHLSDLPENIRNNQSPSHQNSASFSASGQATSGARSFTGTGGATTGTGADGYPISFSLDEVERRHIMRALDFHHGNKTKAAQTLGITLKTLYNKLHRYGFFDGQEGENAHSA